MRVLVYGASGEIYGGIESFLMTMNEHMSRDCIFDYVIVGEKCIHTERIQARGGRIYMVTSYKKDPFRFIIDSWKTAKNARKDHDTAYFNLFSMCHITAVLMSKVLNYRIILHAHNNDIPNKSKAYRMLHRFCRWLLSGMKCTRFTNSEESSVFMFGRKFSGENQAELIYNAIDVKKFRFLPEVREKKRSELNINDKFTVGFAGRLSAQKNTNFLLDIFYEIHKQEPEAVFLVAGEGEKRPEMERRVKGLGFSEQVIFLGRRTDINEIYQAMDCFVLPSLFEGLGIVLVEAQASGLHSFASADVIPPIVQMSENILYFIPLDLSARCWAEKILEKSRIDTDRCAWNDVVEDSSFNILKEAIRLERRLQV